MSSSDSDDELPIARMIAKQNGAAGAEPAAPAVKAKQARAPTTTEAIFDEPDSDDDVPIAQMTKQNGKNNGAARAEDPPAKPKPKTTTEAIFDEPDSEDEAPARRPAKKARAKAKSQEPEDATAGDEELARRLAMGLPPRRASRGGRAPPAPSPPRRKARSPPSSDDEEDEAPEAEEEAPAPKKTKPKAQKGPPRGGECVGERIRVWWPQDRCWYYGEVLSYDGEKHTLLYDDDEEEVVLLGEERHELSPEEAETSSSSEDDESEDLSDDEYTDKIKQEISIKYGKGASWSELFFDPSYERVEGQLEEGRYANAAPRLVPPKKDDPGKASPSPEESDSDEDQSALARAAAYKAAWRDTGRAKRKVKKKTEGPFRLPFPKFGCKRHTSRKKAREAYDAQPYAFFPGDSGTTYQDFTLPLSLVVEAAIEREGEKGRREGKRSLEVALNEFELIHRSERPEDLEEAAKQRFKLCRDEFGSCGCSAKIEELAAERRYWCGVLYCDSSATTLSTRQWRAPPRRRGDARSRR